EEDKEEATLAAALTEAAEAWVAAAGLGGADDGEGGVGRKGLGNASWGQQQQQPSSCPYDRLNRGSKSSSPSAASSCPSSPPSTGHPSPSSPLCKRWWGRGCPLLQSGVDSSGIVSGKGAGQGEAQA
ncbi:unnamed protein product, partial [Discosporangium mesarthrocarpum]